MDAFIGTDAETELPVDHPEAQTRIQNHGQAETNKQDHVQRAVCPRGFNLVLLIKVL